MNEEEKDLPTQALFDVALMFIPNLARFFQKEFMPMH